VPDSHHPFVDKKAWNVMLKAAAVFKPDIIVIQGDFGDCYSISAHDKSPLRTNDLEYEVEQIRIARAQLDALGATRKIFIEGNHEFRLARYLASNAPAVFKMLSIPELFKLKENGWEFVPYKASLRLGKLNMTHDTGTAGQNAHRQSMNAFQGSVVIGHTHRMEFSVTGNADGPPQVGAMFGWLGDFDDIDYMHAIAAKRAWSHGFGLGFMEANGVVHLQPVPIVNGACCVLGQIIR
jgi:predicted phosphodiesterase